MAVRVLERYPTGFSDMATAAPLLGLVCIWPQFRPEISKKVLCLHSTLSDHDVRVGGGQSRTEEGREEVPHVARAGDSWWGLRRGRGEPGVWHRGLGSFAVSFEESGEEVNREQRGGQQRAFAMTSFTGTQERCKRCSKIVYFIEQLLIDEQVFHRSCFRCHHCKRTLKLGSYASLQGVLYCKPHFDQLFKMKGSFTECFHLPEGVKSPVSEVDPLRRSTGDLKPSKFSHFFSGTQDKCKACNKTVYPLEKVRVDEVDYHKRCFRCAHGGCTITPSNYTAFEGRLYCMHHMTQLFKEKGTYCLLKEKPPTGSPRGTGSARPSPRPISSANNGDKGEST
ncbi:hypothetical protein CBR_g19916 [Chara braunii]|uniref:LIM zinc-binding domain-containing protein n=1 Tax=Chara braunii TaxID=69332 RepID=A0A388KZA1_CHABU|nr:hypothetical protein CBR_g19916 [Chara braunii]|eukprot:GBG75283.1 hypothetical protein CBR_g19916 [Chara braunii]